MMYLNFDLDKLVGAIATIREESISAVVAEALELWLQQSQQREIIVEAWKTAFGA
jgi:hypothetical protein